MRSLFHFYRGKISAFGVIQPGFAPCLPLAAAATQRPRILLKNETLFAPRRRRQENVRGGKIKVLATRANPSIFKIFWG
jgi:hypothetical protein